MLSVRPDSAFVAFFLKIDAPEVATKFRSSCSEQQSNALDTKLCDHKSVHHYAYGQAIMNRLVILVVIALVLIELAGCRRWWRPVRPGRIPLPYSEQLSVETHYNEMRLSSESHKKKE